MSAIFRSPRWRRVLCHRGLLHSLSSAFVDIDIQPEKSRRLRFNRRGVSTPLWELNHALTQAGGPTQSQLSRPMSSRHHISMEHRLRRKHLFFNSDTNATNETYLKEIQEKRTKKELFVQRKNQNGKNEKHESGVTLKWAFPNPSLLPSPRPPRPKNLVLASARTTEKMKNEEK